MSDAQTLFEGERFRVVRVERTLPDGRQQSKEVVRHPGAVAILPLLDEDRLCLIRNYRVSAGRTLIEIPAGTLEPNEEPAATARRELIEETGYRASHLELLTSFYPSPGVLDERMYLYLATGLQPGPNDLQPGETIDLFPTTWDDALAMIRDGQIQDAKTIAGLLFFNTFRRKW